MAGAEHDDESFSEELAIAIECAREAGEILLRHWREGAKSWEKSENNPVSEADLAVDEAIRSRLRRDFPNDGLLTEESSDDRTRVERERCWIVDPIDGTREFIDRIPEFAISIALVHRSEPVVGVVYNPVVEALYSGRRGGGCFRNGERVRVTPTSRLRDARAYVSRGEIETEALDHYRGSFAALGPMGSIAWKLALVAGGEIDFNFSLRGKHEWDVCAGDLLVREGGGLYTDLDGRSRRYNLPDPNSRSAMIAGNAGLRDEFIEQALRNDA